MNFRLPSFVIIAASLGLAACTRTIEQPDLNAVVAETLAAVDTVEAIIPADTPVPTATPEVADVLTATPTAELSPTPMSDAEQIKAALIEHLEVEIDPATIEVSEIRDVFARGGLPGGQFFAAKDSGTWLIVFDGNGTPFCSDLEPYDLPVEWLQECIAEDGSVVAREGGPADQDLADLGAPTWSDSMDARGRWYLVSTENTLFEIEGGALVMTALEPGFDEWGVAAGSDQSDFYLEVSVRTGDACSDLDRYGVIFRVPDPSRGYVFQFSCSGRFRLYLWDGSEYTGLQNWVLNEAIEPGPDVENSLGIMAVGDEVKLYANEQLLGEYPIEEYDEGRFGLVVGASETNDFNVNVETVRFWDLSEG